MKPFTPSRLPIGSVAHINHAAPEIIADLGEANRAIAHYDAQMQHTPGAHLLSVPLVRQEALLSSRIEGSQSTFNEVLQFEKDNAGGGEQYDDLSEIQNYVDALTQGAAELAARPFSLSMLKQLHAVLLSGSVRGQTKQPGAFRTGQVWIGRAGAGKERATYIPPDAMLVPELMENWQDYYSADAPDALVQAAILHAQFELIHPFADGNGRLGRLIIPLFLYEKKVISQSGFYLSAYLEKNRDAYMSALRELNTAPGDWHHWILFFLRAVISQAHSSSKKLQQISNLYEDLKHSVRKYTHSQFAVAVLDGIFEKLIFRQATLESVLVKKTGKPPSAPTVSGILKKLAHHGVLEVLEEGRGRRGTTYALTSLLQILEDDTGE